MDLTPDPMPRLAGRKISGSGLDPGGLPWSMDCLIRCGQAAGMGPALFARAVQSSWTPVPQISDQDSSPVWRQICLFTRPLI